MSKIPNVVNGLETIDVGILVDELYRLAADFKDLAERLQFSKTSKVSSLTQEDIENINFAVKNLHVK